MTSTIILYQINGEKSSSLRTLSVEIHISTISIIKNLSQNLPVFCPIVRTENGLREVQGSI